LVGPAKAKQPSVPRLVTADAAFGFAVARSKASGSIERAARPLQALLELFLGRIAEDFHEFRVALGTAAVSGGQLRSPAREIG